MSIPTDYQEKLAWLRRRTLMKNLSTDIVEACVAWVEDIGRCHLCIGLEREGVKHGDGCPVGKYIEARDGA